MGNDEKMGNQSQTPKRIPKAVPRNPSAQYGVDRKYLIPTLGPRDKICRFPPIGEDKFNPIPRNDNATRIGNGPINISLSMRKECKILP